MMPSFAETMPTRIDSKGPSHVLDSIKENIPEKLNEGDGESEVTRLTLLVKSLQDELDNSKQKIFTLQSKEAISVSEKSENDCSNEESYAEANASLQRSLDEANVLIEELTFQRDDFEEKLDLEMGSNQETEQEFEKIKTKLQHEIEHLKECLGEKEAENSSLRSKCGQENSDTNACSGDLECKLGKLEQELEDSNHRNEDLESKLGKLELELEDSNHRNEDLESKLGKLELELEDSNHRNEDLESKLCKLEHEMTEKSSSAIELSAQLDTMKDNVSRLETAMGEQRDENDLLKKGIDDISLMSQCNLGAWMAQFERQIAKEHKNNCTMEENLAALNKLSQEAIACRAELEMQLKASKKFAGEAANDKRVISELQEQKDSLEKELDVLKKDYEAAFTSCKENASKAADAEAMIASLQQEAASLRMEAEESIKLKNEGTDAQKALKQLEEEYTALQAAHNEREEEYCRLISEADELKNSLQSTEEELLGVSSDIIMKENEVDSLTAELKESQDCISSLQENYNNEVAKLQESLSSMRENHEVLQKQRDDFSVENESLRLDITNKLQQLEESQLQLEELSTENSSLSNRIDELNSQLESLVKQLDHTSLIVTELTNSQEKLSLENEELKSAKSQSISSNSLEDKLTEVESDLSGADELISEQQLKIISLESELKEVEMLHTTEVDSLTQTLANAKASAQKFEFEIAELQEKYENLSKELMEGSSKTSDYEDKCNQLETLIADLQCDLAQKDINIETLHTELAQLREFDDSSSRNAEALNNENDNSIMHYQQTITSLKQKVSDLEAELSYASNKAIEESVNSDNRLDEKHLEVQKLNSLIGQKDGEISKLMAEVTSLSDRAATAEASLSKAYQQSSISEEGSDAQAKRCLQLQTQVDLLSGEKCSLIQKVADAEAEIKRLENAAEITENKLRHELNQVSNSCHKLEEEISCSRSTQNALVECQRSLASKSSEYDNLFKSFTALQEELSALKASHAKLEEDLALQKDSSELHFKLESVEAENESLRQNLNDAQLQVAELTNRVKRGKDDVNAMAEEVSKQFTTIESLEKEKQELLASLESQERADELNDMSSMSKSFEEMKEANIILEEKNFDLQSQLDCKIDECNECTQKCQNLQSSIENLTQQLEEAKASYGDNFKELEEQSRQLATRNETLQQELDSLLAGAAEERSQKLSQIEKLEEEIVQRDKEIALLGKSKSDVSNDEHQQLIAEMNTLMEEKMEAESKIQAAESETKQLRLELSNYDKKSAKEVAMMMEAAQTEMDNLKSSFEKEKEEGIRKIQELSSQLQETIKENAELEEKLTHAIKASESKTSLETELDEVIASSNMLQLQIDEDSKAYHALEKEHEILQKKFTDYKTEIEEVIDTKDKRIARLEKSKLTTDQVEKIKQVRENCSKKTEECKIYKKQLAQLKKAYESLQQSTTESETRRSTRSKTKESSESAELAELQVNLGEVQSQLDQANFVTKTLKEKLKDCSKQLQEYEQERQSIVHILEECEIDVGGLMLNDESNADESIVEQDLSDPVSKLAQNWKAAKTLNSSLKARVADAEERFMSLSSDVESSHTQKLALEKKLEASKNALKESKAQIESYAAQLETSRLDMEKVKQELATAKNSISGNEEAVSTEIQVLEEENIELLRENKELRIASATYRAKAEALAKKLGGADDEDCQTLSLSKRRVAEVSEAESPEFSNRNKRSKETRVEVEVEAEKNKKTGTPSRSFGTELDANTLHSNQSSICDQGSTKKQTPASSNRRRGRRVRAKAAVSSTNGSSEQPGECTQS